MIIEHKYYAILVKEMEHNKLKITFNNKVRRLLQQHETESQLEPIKPEVTPPVQWPTVSEVKVEPVTWCRVKSQPIKTNPVIDNSDHITLSYHDIQKMYDYYGIYRIRLHYILLNRKLHTLSASLLTTTHISLKEYHYDELVAEEAELQTCLRIYIVFTTLLECMTLLMKTGKNATRELQTTINSISNAEHLFVDKFATYADAFRQYMAHLKSSVARKTVQYTTQINKLINDLIKRFDPTIDCEYFVILKVVDGHASIIPSGLSSADFYLDCQDVIDLSTFNELHNDDELDNLNELLNRHENFELDHFITISHAGRLLHINYSLEENIEPNERRTLKIVDLPVHATSCTSIITNPTYSGEPPPSINITDNWFDYRHDNPLYCITYADYNTLKTTYDYEDTDKNIFVVDYLFSQLLEHDTTNIIIKYHMLASFRRLAATTSPHLLN